MQINRWNYEAYLLDMIEGELSPEREEELMLFLSRNPELEVCPDLKDITLSPSKLDFPVKEDIKKGASGNTITVGNYQQHCIARVEGDLSAEGERALDNFLLENPECVPTARLYEKLVLRTDKNINFPHKHLLKRKSPEVKYLPGFFSKRVVRLAVSVAASVAILLSASVYIWNSKRYDQPFSNSDKLEIAISRERESSLNLSVMPVREIEPERITEIYAKSIPSSSLGSENLHDKGTVKESGEKTGNSFSEREPLLRPIQAKLLSNIETSSPGKNAKGLQLAGLYQPPFASNEKEIIGRRNIINDVTGILAGVIDSSGEQEKLSFWDLADAGVRGINKLAGTGMQLEREYNQEGDVVSLAFNSGLIEFKRSTSSFRD